MDKEKRSYAFAAGMSLGAAVLLAVLMRTTLTHVSGFMEAAKLSVLFTLGYAAALFAFVRIEKPGPQKLMFVGGFMAISLFARCAMLDFVTADYNAFLEPWIGIFRKGGFAMLAENVGDYNLLYQYVMLLISKSALYPLYLIKLVTVFFDYVLAVTMLLAARRLAGERAGVPVMLLTLALPTVLTDGACWGQCDPVYASAVVLSLYALSDGKPTLSAASLALAFAFKLQTIFFFPIVLLGLIKGEFKLRHALVFFATYVLTLIPALVAGRSFVSALSVYANQSMGQYYDRLSYNAPNLYLFFPMLEFASSQEYTWMRYIEGVDKAATNPYILEWLMPTLQNAALLACVLLTLVVVIYWLAHHREITMEMMPELALFFAIYLPFVMPKIHDRYFFLADMLSVLVAARHKDRRFLPILVVGASFMCYIPYLTRQRPLDERGAALMMLAALVIVSRDLLCGMRRNRMMLAGGDMQ